MKTIITSNSTKIAKRYRNMARNLPGLVHQAIGELAREEALPLFQNTTRTWVHQPTFEAQPTARGWQIATNSQIYAWVDRGTRPHIIEAKRGKLLRFRVPFTPKTKLGVIASYRGGRGNQWVSKKRVHHPGTEARNFSDIIMRRIQTRAANKVRESLNQASYGAGTGL